VECQRGGGLWEGSEDLATEDAGVVTEVGGVVGTWRLRWRLFSTKTGPPAVFTAIQ
jgi:hypothetical protein